MVCPKLFKSTKEGYNDKKLISKPKSQPVQFIHERDIVNEYEID